VRELRETPAETGTVLRVAPGRAWVRLARNEACSACKGCAIGAGLCRAYLIGRRRRGGIGVFIVAEILHKRARPR